MLLFFSTAICLFVIRHKLRLHDRSLFPGQQSSNTYLWITSHMLQLYDHIWITCWSNNREAITYRRLVAATYLCIDHGLLYLVGLIHTWTKLGKKNNFLFAVGDVGKKANHFIHQWIEKLIIFRISEI